MISKKKLQENVDAVKTETKTALLTLFDALNQGQQKKLLKDPDVKALLLRYGVIGGEDDED